MSESRLQQDVFNKLLSLVAKAGITQEKLLYQARINGLSASDSSISSDTEAVIFLSTAAELINDPYLGPKLLPWVALLECRVLALTFASSLDHECGG